MADVVCEECGEIFEISSGDSVEDYECTKCKGDLKFLEKSSTKTHKNTYVRENISIGKGYIDKQSSKYNNLIYIGLGIVIIALLGLLLSSSIIFAFLILAGYFALVFGYNEAHKWKKGVEGEKYLAEYLNQLPRGYYIFNDVKLPNKRGNIDYIVLGPSGLFIIETMKRKGIYTVHEDGWIFEGSDDQKNSYTNPGKTLKNNTLALMEYLLENKVNLDIGINSIVTFNGQYTIKRRPQNYDIIPPGEVTAFILKGKNTLNEDIITEYYPLIKSYAMEYSQ